MRVRSFLGVVATLLAIATSTSVSVAGSDWPKSLTLVTGPAGWGVLRLWRSARTGSDREARHCCQPFADPRLGPQREAHRERRGAARDDYDGGRPAGLERHRRLDQREATPRYACAVSIIRHAFSSRGPAAIRHCDPRTARQEADRCRIARGHRRHLYASNVEGSGDFSRNQLWIVRQYGHRAFGRSHRRCR